MRGDAAGYSLEDTPELGEDMTRMQDLQLANWQSFEVVAAVVVIVVEGDMYCKLHFAARLQGSLGSRLTLVYCTVDTVAEEARTSTLIVVCRKILVEDCQYKNSPRHQAHWECSTKSMGTLLKSAFEEGDCNRQLYVDCTCSTDVLRACGRSNVQRLKVWHVNRGVHLCSLGQNHILHPK